jgi:hypothetical protein
MLLFSSWGGAAWAAEEQTTNATANNRTNQSFISFLNQQYKF